MQCDPEQFRFYLDDLNPKASDTDHRAGGVIKYMNEKKKGKFVYKSKRSMLKMYKFYDKAMDSLNIGYWEKYIYTSFGKTHIMIAGDENKPHLFTLHGGNGITPLNLKLFSPLFDSFCIIAPDVIGMPGKSEPFRNLNTKKDDFGHWISEILDKLEIRNISFIVSSYSSAMLLSLAKTAPERINKAVFLVPSGIAHGSILPIIYKMSVPFIKYYYAPSEKSLKGIISAMSSQNDILWNEFFKLMMSEYKMEMRAPKEYKKSELMGFMSETVIFASNEDLFFPAYKVFPKADDIFRNKPLTYKIKGKHLPSESTMLYVCNNIEHFLLNKPIENN